MSDRGFLEATSHPLKGLTPVYELKSNCLAPEKGARGNTAALRKNDVWTLKRCQISFDKKTNFYKKLVNISLLNFRIFNPQFHPKCVKISRGKIRKFPEKCIFPREKFGNIGMLIWRIAVRQNGRGIPRKVAPKIIDRSANINGPQDPGNNLSYTRYRGAKSDPSPVPRQ